MLIPNTLETDSLPPHLHSNKILKSFVTHSSSHLDKLNVFYHVFLYICHHFVIIIILFMHRPVEDMNAYTILIEVW